MTNFGLRAIRGRLLTFLRAPNSAGDSQSYRYIEDGIVVVKDGKIEAAEPAAQLTTQLPAGL
jgi:guanine deaminase